MSSGLHARKRKHWSAGHPASDTSFTGSSNLYESSTPDWHEASNKFAHNPALYVRAEEADVLQNTEHIAESLDASSGSLATYSSTQRSALVQAQWGTAGEPAWVDRYDARILLTSVPGMHNIPKTINERGGRRTSSPAGWSDLPSDEEDTFFLSASEVEDVYRAKRRRRLDDDRQQRLRLLQDAEPADSHGDVDTESVWGGSDEECSQAQLELMRRTASHISSSENSAQLEMRILANHGGDERFAFLRGRWKRRWLQEKAAALHEKESSRCAAAKSCSGLDVLAGYSDSDEDSEASHSMAAEPQTSLDLTERRPSPNIEAICSEDSVMEARRARAREWAENRRAAKSSSLRV